MLAVQALKCDVKWGECASEKRGSVHTYCNFTQHNAEAPWVQLGSQPMVSFLLTSQPPHPGICSPNSSIIKEQLHKESEFLTANNHTSSLSLSCKWWYQSADYD